MQKHYKKSTIPSKVIYLKLSPAYTGGGSLSLLASPQAWLSSAPSCTFSISPLGSVWTIVGGTTPTGVSPGGTGNLLELDPSSSPDILGFAPLLNAAAEILPPPVLDDPPNVLVDVGEVGVIGVGESRPVGMGIGMGGGGGGAVVSTSLAVGGIT